ncbi:hypothetical protein J1N35_014282 [Gossypium stocksii]|uniref:Uncharacterized protein n=1 Tax=Gossypium stocksii TaxID=47602 RepID=A0A9D3VVR9_9ROSI|nr:hypothetical protein J1N35_014282 [Gossypium stocksii]
MNFFEKNSQASTPLEEVTHDVTNFDLKDQCTFNKNLELNLESQQEFRIRDGNKLNITEEIFDPIKIDIEVEVVVDVEVQLTTNLELKPILNERVDESIHFLAIIEEVLTKEIDEFILFSFNEEDKARVNRTSRDMEVK